MTALFIVLLLECFFILWLCFKLHVPSGLPQVTMTPARKHEYAVPPQEAIPTDEEFESTFPPIPSDMVVNPLYGRDPKEWHLCMTNCWNTGAGSRIMAMSMAYELARIHGFKIYFQDATNDWFRGIMETIDHVAPVFEQGHHYFPSKCDYVFSGWDMRCFMHTVFWLTSYYHVPMYDELMYRFFQGTYSHRLRDIAQELYERLLLEHPHEVIIGVHVRFEDLIGGRKDTRTKHKTGYADYLELMEFFHHKLIGKDKQVLYLVMGDKAVRFFKERTDVIFIEEYVQSFFPAVTGLQAQFVAMDISSRFRHRIVHKFSNNFYMHMAFHKLNHRTDAVVGDAFSLRTYTYEGIVLDIVNNERFNISYWRNTQANPYTGVTDLKYYNKLKKCFHSMFFVGSSDHVSNKMASLNDCEKEYLRTEVKPHYL